MVVQKGTKRGHCSVCGYAAWLAEDGLLPEHVVRRVNAQGRVYASTAVEDDSCAGVGQLPEPLPPRKIKRMIARRIIERILQ